MCWRCWSPASAHTRAVPGRAQWMWRLSPRLWWSDEASGTVSLWSCFACVNLTSIVLLFDALWQLERCEQTSVQNGCQHQQSSCILHVLHVLSARNSWNGCWSSGSVSDSGRTKRSGSHDEWAPGHRCRAPTWHGLRFLHIENKNKMSAATITNKNKAETSRDHDHVHGQKAASDWSECPSVGWKITFTRSAAVA